MSARAMWKGIVTFEDVRVPVKLYAAVQDRDVHFRLVHATDLAPVRQVMVDPETDEAVPYEETRRAFVGDEKQLVVLRDEELAELDPEPSRDITVLQFLPPEVIDHRWYVRPYSLGPDGAPEPYFALAEALARDGREGLAHWTMRDKDYAGALRLHAGYPVLITLRSAESIVPLEELRAPPGPAPDEKELKMARQLVDALAGTFDPEAYGDEHRARVEQLVETKARGGRVKTAPRRAPRPSGDLLRALRASVERERKRA